MASITQNGENLAYTYDDAGNILSETRGNVTVSYEYDALGQLVRVNDPNDTTADPTGTTWVYTYDQGGNILSKAYYPYTTGSLGTPTGTVTYTYGDSNWKDKLTAYNGTPISYDAIGNPTNDGTWSYVWEKGRQLKQMTSTGTTATFDYNADGLRVRKTVNGIVTNYILHGKNIVHLTQGSESLHFYYDAQNRPAIVDYNGILYRYIYNLQGDVLGLLDSSNNEVVQYTYDAWGKILSVTGTLASTVGTVQPFRYRGYVYDVETGLYYLRSRYYNSCWNRFINEDCITSNNSFAYCNNIPPITIDKNGTATQLFSEMGFGSCVFIGDGSVCHFCGHNSDRLIVGSSNNIVPFLEKIDNTVLKVEDTVVAIIDSVSVEVGAGLGAGGSVSEGFVSLSGVFRADLFLFRINARDGVKAGKLMQFGMGAGIAVPGVDELATEGGLTVECFHPYNASNCNCSGVFPFSEKCPATIFNLNANTNATFGLSFYLGIGFTAQVSVDISQIRKEINEIWK